MYFLFNERFLKMNKNLILSIVSLFVFNCFAVDDTQLRIKIVEGRKVLSESTKGKSIEANLNKVREKLYKDINNLKQELEKDVNEFRARAKTVKEEVLAAEQEKILRKEKELKLKEETAQEEFGRTVQRELAKFNAELQEVVTELAKEKGWDIVHLKETGEIIYTSARVNGTDDIIKKVDLRHNQERTVKPGTKQV